MRGLERFVDKIIQEMESGKEEREDIKEEMLTHLTQARDHYLAEGYSKKDAELKAITSFGYPHELGQEMQEAMYPFQKQLLNFIGIGTLIIASFMYLSFMITHGATENIWLLVQCTFGFFITFFSINLSIIQDRLWLVNTAVFLVSLNHGISFFLAGNLKNPTNYISFLMIVLLIVACVMYLFRNAWLHSKIGSTNRKEMLYKRAIHLINLLLGTLLGAFAIFMSWGILVFTGVTWLVLVPLIVLGIWGLIYLAQYKIARNHPMASLLFGILSFIGVGILGVMFYS